MKGIRRIAFGITLISLSLISCSTIRSNKQEIKIENKVEISKSNDVVIFMENEDQHLGSAITNALKEKGFKVINVTGNTASASSDSYYKITYKFEKAFSSWSMHVIMKQVDISVYDQNDILLMKYNWKVRYNKASNVKEIGKEFVDHFVNMK